MSQSKLIVLRPRQVTTQAIHQARAVVITMAKYAPVALKKAA